MSGVHDSYLERRNSEKERSHPRTLPENSSAEIAKVHDSASECSNPDEDKSNSFLVYNDSTVSNSPNNSNNFDGPPFHMACAYGCIEAVDMLLDHGVDINCIDEFELTSPGLLQRRLCYL